MALGMTAMMALPMNGDASQALEAYFGVNCALTICTWSIRVFRRRAARARGLPVPCRPAHALEPHHLIVGLAMVLMAAQMSSIPSPSTTAMADMSATVAMPAMTPTPHTIGTALAALALLYVWAAVVVFGGGLAKLASAASAASEPVPAAAAPSAGLALLGAPRTVYACELTMTVVMGLMLLG
jgi:hypothetical protein